MKKEKEKPQFNEKELKLQQIWSNNYTIRDRKFEGNWLNELTQEDKDLLLKYRIKESEYKFWDYIEFCYFKITKEIY